MEISPTTCWNARTTAPPLSALMTNRDDAKAYRECSRFVVFEVIGLISTVTLQINVELIDDRFTMIID